MRSSGAATANSPGLLTLLEKEYATATKPQTREQLETFRGEVACAACGGARLRPEARSVRFGGKAIHEICRLTRGAMPSDSSPRSRSIADDAADRRAAWRSKSASGWSFWSKVGLDYLTLDRPADTLSGGELQRVRLATGIGSGLVGVCYVLDEPSIGLHPRDNDRLIASLRDLQQQGNTVLVVEHDEAMMRAGRLADRHRARRGRARRRDRRRGHARRSAGQSRRRSPAGILPASCRFPCRPRGARSPRRGRSRSKA